MGNIFCCEWREGGAEWRRVGDVKPTISEIPPEEDKQESQEGIRQDPAAVESIAETEENPHHHNDDDDDCLDAEAGQVVTKRQQPEGFALILSETGGLTLTARWIKAGKDMPQGIIALLRIAGEVDDYKVLASPLICGQNLRAQWTAQAKAISLYVKTCAALRGELELLPNFGRSLPNAIQLVCHHPDRHIKAILSPGVFDFESHNVDSIALLPAGKDYFKGMSDVDIASFIEIGIRKGAALRL